MPKPKKPPTVECHLLAALAFTCSRRGHDFTAYVAQGFGGWMAMGLSNPSSTSKEGLTSAELFAHHAHEAIGVFPHMKDAQEAAVRWVQETPAPAAECGCPDMAEQRSGVQEQEQGHPFVSPFASQLA